MTLQNGDYFDMSDTTSGHGDWVITDSWQEPRHQIDEGTHRRLLEQSLEDYAELWRKLAQDD